MTIDERADEGWDQCIACGAARTTRFFCQGCLDNKVDVELSNDNPILHRAERDARTVPVLHPERRMASNRGHRRRSRASRRTFSGSLITPEWSSACTGTASSTG